MTRSPGWTPNYKAFLVTGAVVGFIAGAVIALVRPSSGAYSQGSEIGYVGLFGAVVGIALGGVVALVADSIGRRSIPPAEPGRRAGDETLSEPERTGQDPVAPEAPSGEPAREDDAAGGMPGDPLDR